MTAILRTPVISHQLRGRTFTHWTPRYVHARFRQALYQKAHPDAPWLTPAAIRLVDSMLRPEDIGAEFGSGRSTVWLARRCAHLVSVEHDVAWHARVSKALAAAGAAHVEYLCHPRDEPDARGDRSAYAQVARHLDDESIDFALVDGVYRDHVALYLLPKLKPGGLLIIDNVNRYLPSWTKAPSSLRPPQPPATAAWQRVADELASWRRIWTSNGVSATAIFTKASASPPASQLTD